MSLESHTLIRMAMGISKEYLAVEFKGGLALLKSYTIIKTTLLCGTTKDKVIEQYRKCLLAHYLKTSCKMF